ncbi:MAG: hypothetical protein AAGJ82_07625, partial [Bacteroidota bacterium]
MKTNLNRTSLLLIFGLLLPYALTSDCGMGGEQKFYGYTFINPEITEFDQDLAPFFLDFTTIHENFFATQKQLNHNGNAEEWRARFCENATLKDIKYLVYEASRFQLEDLRSAMGNSNVNARQRRGIMADNSWARYLLRHQCRETVDYLIFAKRCEPYVTLPKNSWESRKIDVPAMRQLIKVAGERFLRLGSDYIKLRYAYQAIRLAHYVKDYELTLELVQYYLPKIDNDPSILEYWIMGHEAGALQALGRRPEAAYRYAKIFDKCPSKRESAFRSFRIETDEEWTAALNLCRSDHERASLYVLRANSSSAHLIQELENIYAYDPQHHALEMLMVKEMQHLERDLLGEEFNPKRSQNQRRHNIPRANAGERVIELQQLIRQWLREGQLPEPTLWKLALGYLEVLAGDFYYAERTFADVDDLLTRKQKSLREQLDIFRLVLRILTIDEADTDAERELANMGNDYDFYAEYPDFSKMITDKLRILYREQGSGAKAYLMEYSLAQLKAKPDLDIIDELVAICRKPNRTIFEQRLVEYQDGSTIEYELLDAKAAFLMGQGSLETALRVMKEIPDLEWDNYGQFNPFVRRFKDCVRCPLPDTVTTYNRGQLIEEMLEIEFEARAATSADVAASYYFDLGEAFYNITYFGNSWKATDIFRSGRSAERAFKNKGQTVFAHPGLPLGNRENFNCDRARR